MFKENKELAVAEQNGFLEQIQWRKPSSNQDGWQKKKQKCLLHETIYMQFWLNFLFLLMKFQSFSVRPIGVYLIKVSIYCCLPRARDCAKHFTGFSLFRFHISTIYLFKSSSRKYLLTICSVPGVILATETGDTVIKGKRSDKISALLGLTFS